MKNKITLSISFLVHFAVDLACIYYVTGILLPLARSHSQYLAWTVFYNFMAFAIPAGIGYLADRMIRRRHLCFAGCGCFLITCGYLLKYLPAREDLQLISWLPVFLIGLGNGIFHVGAGIQVLDDCRDCRMHYAPPGIFISSGALGVFLGGFWGRQYLPLWNVFACMTALCGIVLVCWDLGKDRLQPESAAKEPSEHGTGLLWLPAAMLFVVVVIRSYYGSILSYDWKTGFTIGLIFTLCIVGGKFFGGIVADLLGIRAAIWISLGLGAVTAFFSFDSPVMGCISIFLFNMTMPLTLSLLAGLFPQYPGFAFGLLMLALFLGTLPVMVLGFHGFFSPAGLVGLCLFSLVLLRLSCRAEKRPL